MKYLKLFENWPDSSFGQTSEEYNIVGDIFQDIIDEYDLTFDRINWKDYHHQKDFTWCAYDLGEGDNTIVIYANCSNPKFENSLREFKNRIISVGHKCSFINGRDEDIKNGIECNPERIELSKRHWTIEIFNINYPIQFPD